MTLVAAPENDLHCIVWSQLGDKNTFRVTATADYRAGGTLALTLEVRLRIRHLIVTTRLPTGLQSHTGELQ